MKKLIFVLFSLATIFGLAIEVYTFKNFLFKHLFISTELLACVSVFTGFQVLNSKVRSKGFIDYISKLVFKLNTYLYIPLTLVYFYLNYLNQTNFPNYVFSRYHLQPILIIRLIVFSICFTIILYLKKRLPIILASFKNLKSKNRKFEIYLSLALIILLVVYFVNNLLLDMSTLSPYISATFKNVRSSSQTRYDVMMRMKYGAYYDYMQFVKSVTDEESTILLPPQKNPWQYEGNQRLSRFFLYPRTLYSAHEPNLPEKTDFILIAWGRPEFEPLVGDSYGWPNYNINADEVLIYDIKNNKYESYKENYDPKKFLNEGVYGIIKTK